MASPSARLERLPPRDSAGRPGSSVAAAAAAAACRPIEAAEVAAVAHTMNLAGAGAGGGAGLLPALLDGRADLPELAQRIKAQPAIAVRVLRVANSAYYGHSGGVATVDRAAQVVGVTALRGIAAAACFDRMTAPSVLGIALDLTAFRLHSLATACAAQALALHFAPAWTDEAFSAGLLHDLGLVAQWRLRPAWRAGFDQAGPNSLAAAEPAVSMRQLELRRFGASHADCGRVLLEAWHLPRSLVDAVAGHDVDPRSGLDDPDPAALLGLADRLACDTGFGFPGDRLPAAAAPTRAAAQDIGILAVIAGRLPVMIERLGVAFGD